MTTSDPTNINVSCSAAKKAGSDMKDETQQIFLWNKVGSSGKARASSSFLHHNSILYERAKAKRCMENQGKERGQWIMNDTCIGSEHA